MEPMKKLTKFTEPHNKFLKKKQKKQIVTYQLMLLSKLEVLYLIVLCRYCFFGQLQN